jgi:hypothetical protein
MTANLSTFGFRNIREMHSEEFRSTTAPQPLAAASSVEANREPREQLVRRRARLNRADRKADASRMVARQKNTRGLATLGRGIAPGGPTQACRRAGLTSRLPREGIVRPLPNSLRFGTRQRSVPSHR